MADVLLATADRPCTTAIAVMDGKRTAHEAGLGPGNDRPAKSFRIEGDRRQTHLDMHIDQTQPLVSCRQHVARFGQPGTQLMQSYCLCTCADFLESMDPSVRIKLRSMFDDGMVGRLNSSSCPG